MRRNRLNLSVLHKQREPKSVHVSRRTFLGLAGVTAVSVSPALKAMEKVLQGSFEFQSGRNRAVFKFGGKDAWVIDTRNFAGSPKLKATRTDDRIHLRLSGARYPATDLSADFDCQIRRGVGGWRMQLRLSLGGFNCTVPFERWLAGSEMASSSVNCHTQVCRLNGASHLALSGMAHAEFSPKWTLQLTGAGIATLSGLGEKLKSDRLNAALLGPGFDSLMSRPVSKRTLITLERGENSWQLEPSGRKNKNWTVTSDGSAFDVLKIEAGESRAGTVRRALLAESTSAASRLFFKPGGRMKDNENQRFRLPLQNPRYAVAFDAHGDQTALIADFSKEPVWLQTGRVSLQLGSCTDTPPFELIGRAGKLQKMQCEPALLALAAPLAGAIVEPITFPEETRLAFVQDKKKRSRAGRRSKLGRVQLGKQKGKTSLTLPATFTLSVVRPQDLLTLKFSFYNFDFNIEEGQPAQFKRVDRKKAAYVVAEFPPQNIAEQAFFEAADDQDLPVKKPDYLEEQYDVTESDPDEGNSQSDELDSPPVKSRLAGPSRLAFFVPKGVDTIEYSLQGLLEWGGYEQGYEQKVAAAAKPPPVTFILSQILTDLVKSKPPVTLMAKEDLDKSRRSARSKPSLEQQLAVLAPMFEGKLDPGVIQQIQEPGGIVKNIDAETRGRLQVQINDELKQAAQIVPQLSDPALSSHPVTFIEAPYRLLISPNKYAGWAHSSAPVANSATGRTELWHTRLGVRKDDGRIDEATAFYRKVRAIWAKDFNPKKVYPAPGHSNADPFRMSLDGRDRHELVHLTANFKKYPTPLPVDVDRLMLTSLGAWMNLRGAWPHWQLNAMKLTVEEWRHLAAMARDNYVRVVYKGYLFPFGHRASLIKVTERKFQPADKGSMKGRTSAYLRQRMFIVVRQPEMTYSGFGYNHEGREMPFKSVRITTLITPDLDKPENSDINGALQSAFWPRVGNDDFRFHLVAEDTEGQKCEFTIPLIFLENPIAKGDPEAPVPLTGATGDQTTALGNYLLLDERRTADLSGQKVAFAESKTLGDTSFETASIKFTAEIPGFSLGDDVAKFLPIVQRAQVDIPALKQILGTSTAAWVTFHDRYESNGFDPAYNKGEVFVKLIDEAGTNDEYELNFGGNNQGDKVGGVITPNLNIQGISRVLGPVGGSHNSKIVDGIFDPVEFFQNADPKILGGIPLSDIIDLLTDSNDMPKFVQQQLPKELLTTYTWETTKLTVDDKNIFIPKSNASLTVNTVMRTKLPDVNADPEFEVTGSIKNFKMNLFGFIIISFDEFTFFTLNGRKPDVDVIMSQPDGIMFGGPLAFLNELKEYIPLDGFSDPPDLAVTPSGIKATYSLGLPDIAFGIFSLQNVSLDAGLAIPFNGDPARARFSFCERENPFLLTVSMFGGGGFAGLAVGLDGVEIVEASMEFGGCFAFDIGIASGAIYAFAGFYFKWGIQENGSEGVLLSAYFRMGGAVEVVGLICVSIELYLAMDYIDGAMAGQATLTITIDILVFSHSWDVTVRREFAASPPPRFKDMTSLSHWQTYCETFA